MTRRCSTSRALRFCAVSLLLATCTWGLGCRRRHVEGTVSTDSVLSAWKGLGFDTDEVKEVDRDVWEAGACAQGSVAGVAVLMCEYADDEALARGEQRVRESWNPEEVATALVARASRTLLAVTDHGGADPEGRNIARLVTSFRQVH